MSDGAMYLPDGDGFIGTVRTQGGWHPEQQNGAAVLSLLGHCLEDVPSLVPMTLARMTVDLVRPVPIGPRLDVRAEILREGKKIQVVQQELVVGDVVHARATVLRLRDADLRDAAAVPESAGGDPAAAMPRPDDCLPMGNHPGAPGFLEGIEMRRAPSGSIWVRFARPVVEGHTIRATSKLVLGFDFANLIGVTFDMGAVTLINPDVSGHVLRPPEGEWIAVTGETRFAPAHGRGVSVATLSDEQGVFGFCETSQLIQRRD